MEYLHGMKRIVESLLDFYKEDNYRVLEEKKKEIKSIDTLLNKNIDIFELRVSDIDVVSFLTGEKIDPHEVETIEYRRASSEKQNGKVIKQYDDWDGKTAYKVFFLSDKERKKVRSMILKKKKEEKTKQLLEYKKSLESLVKRCENKISFTLPPVSDWKIVKDIDDGEVFEIQINSLSKNQEIFYLYKKFCKHSGDDFEQTVILRINGVSVIKFSNIHKEIVVKLRYGKVRMPQIVRSIENKSILSSFRLFDYKIMEKTRSSLKEGPER